MVLAADRRTLPVADRAAAAAGAALRAVVALRVVDRAAEVVGATGMLVADPAVVRMAGRLEG